MKRTIGMWRMLFSGEFFKLLAKLTERSQKSPDDRLERLYFGSEVYLISLELRPLELTLNFTLAFSTWTDFGETPPGILTNL